MAEVVDMSRMEAGGKWDFAAASHLLQRAGFGGAIAEIEAIQKMGLEKGVEFLVKLQGGKDDLPPMPFGELSGPIGEIGRGGLRARQQMMQGMDQRDRQALNQLNQAARNERLAHMKTWWLDRMIRTVRPLEEKMTLFWHGLLVSSFTTVKNSYHLYLQNQLLRKHAVGNYKDLILAISKDPAMLEYLNNNQNKKAKPNENYARELMELFTMGIGNYTENDIKNSARAFSGWTFAGESFVFNPREHDTGEKTFLGKTGNFDGTDIIRIIFEQPATAKYIAGRLIKFFAVDEPPAEAVEALAKVIRASNYEIAPALTTLFSSKWFYSRPVMRTQIKSPVQLVVGSFRMLGLNITTAQAVETALRQMGQDLFNAPTVKGWDGGRDWINTSTLFSRYNLPAYVVTGRLPTMGKRAADDAMVRAQFAEFQSPWSPQNDLADAGVSTTDGVVDYYVKKLIQDKIEQRKRDELVEYLNGTGDAKTHLFDPVAPDAERQVRSLVHLIMSMAEYQVC
jgi:uncharacterized protein (DUF1800 family)